MATFLPPLSREKMVEHWQKLFDETNDKRLIFVCVSKVADRLETGTIDAPFEGHDWLISPTVIGSKEGKGEAVGAEESQESALEVSGVVSLSMPESQTGPFRGLVQKLFISPYHRRKGVARRLMAELEREAFKRNKWSLMLDTTVGTAAEYVYPELGYRVLGVVKNYGFTPKDHTLVDEIFFWKDLRVTRV